ncbi:DHBP synthase RibB-like alpha/beta domain-containing protein [Mrakia frigida]|uniref:threonylcarbamoyladenylate synthase n=1 Tax=Mrakia frigida TaxID=29902 RepID=UPI003FCBF346
MLRRAFHSTTSTSLLRQPISPAFTKMESSPSFQTLLLQTVPSSISFPSGIDSDAPPVITDPETERVIKLAAQKIRDGDLVAFPTETVYGLGANALSGKAVERIYKAKGRPSDNPLILHISSLPMLHSLLLPPTDPSTPLLSPLYASLIASHWPGPLTLLFPTNPSLIPTQTTASLPTVAIRLPSHPVARALIHFAGVPLAAPSANSSGRPSPTRGEHVMRDLGGREGVSVILEGGNCEVGVESTVAVEEESNEQGGRGDLKVLRPGGVTVEQLREVVRRVDRGEGKRERKVLVYSKDFKDEKMEKAPTTPGMKYKHYTPSIPVYLLSPVLDDASSSSLPSTSTTEINDSDASNTLSTPPSSTAPSPNLSSSSPTTSKLPTPLEAVFSLLPATTAIPSKPIGLMLYDNSPLSLLLPSPPSTSNLSSSSLSPPATTTPSPPISDSHTYIYHPLGSLQNPSQAANRLFDGLLRLEREGCGVIFIEEGEEEGVGRAVGERVGKATGGEKGRVLVRV